MAGERILVVEDHPDVADLLQLVLSAEGYEVLVAYDGAQALATVRHEQLDLMLLDLMLPIIDGVEVCRQTREMSVLPIIMLTAKTSEQDKITGLEAGADDYIEKPFSNGELTARVRAQLRRARALEHGLVDAPIIRLGSLTLEPSTMAVQIDRKAVHVTRLEFDLLYALGRRPGHVMTREQLLELVWDDSEEIQPRSVDVHVRRLRTKIETDARHPQRLLTVHSVGYKLVAV